MLFPRLVVVIASILLESIFTQSLAAPVTATGVEIRSTGNTTQELARNAATVSKRIVLWDWTLTQQVNAYPGIQSSASSLANSPVAKTVINWETWRPTELPPALRFQPTVRTRDYLSGDNWKNIQNVVNGGRVTVHFYNEPERASPSITAAQAAADWRTSMIPLRQQHGAKLVSPACASDAAGTAWMNDFMGRLSAAEKPDLVGLHYYSNQGSNAADSINAAKTYLKNRHKKFGLPVVVREIASTSRDYGVVKAFTMQMSAWMDGQGFVSSYGFFGCSLVPKDGFVSPQAQLMTTDGHWNELGHFMFGV
ncbi:glycoside hydrolase family 128 protein [Xylariaceae sp. FL1019]|nr:glycoside hydrolase family 128 protein [Xylariaceae sp. FL1019]